MLIVCILLYASCFFSRAFLPIDRSMSAAVCLGQISDICTNQVRARGSAGAQVEADHGHPVGGVVRGETDRQIDRLPIGAHETNHVQEFQQLHPLSKYDSDRRFCRLGLLTASDSVVSHPSPCHSSCTTPTVDSTSSASIARRTVRSSGRTPGSSPTSERPRRSWS